MQGRKYWFIHIENKVISKRIYKKREATKTLALLRGTPNLSKSSLGSFIVKAGEHIIDDTYEKLFKQIVRL